MIVRAPEQDVAIPDVALTPFLLERAVARGDKPAFIDGPTGRTLTYRGWAEDVHKAAAGLAARGFRKGDVFAIYSPNLPEYAVAFHAVSLLGGIVTTINPLYTSAELSCQLKDAGARALVTVPACLDKAVHAARESGVREVFVFGDGGQCNAVCCAARAKAETRRPSRSIPARRSSPFPTPAARRACPRA